MKTIIKPKNKKAFITGITGQDGSYLAELLLEKGYEVHGLIRRSSTFNTSRIDHLYQDPHIHGTKLFLHFGDLADSSNLNRLLSDIKPDEIYHLGAQSHVRVSFDIPEYTADVTGLGTIRILDAMREVGLNKTKFYQACYSEDTLVLTAEGLKKYTDIKNGDLVYSLNPQNREIELKPVLKVLKYDYSGDMIHFKSRRMDILVTPNHKMLIEDDEQLINFIEAEKIPSLLRYDRTSNLSLPTVTWKGDRVAEIDFSKYIDLKNKSDNTYKNLLTSMKSEDFCYLLGLYIGDGYTKGDKKAKVKCSRKEFRKYRNKEGKFISPEICELKEVKYKSNFIQFALPAADKSRNKLILILKKYNIEYIVNDDTINFSSYPLSMMFKLSGENVYEKQIPKWILELSPDLLYRVFEGLIDSDGHVRKIKNERYVYTTVSPMLAKDFIELTYKINKIPTLKIEQPIITYFKKDNRMCGYNSKPIYRISVAHKNKNKIYKYNIKKEKYIGKVWCLKIKDNHNFLVYRNNRFAFSGNSSSEMFGKALEIPLKETTPFHPRSPYGCAKVYSYWITKNYRESYGMFASNGILFNHESPRRGETFVTKKITHGLARIKLGKEEKLYLGNLDAKRDWGYAKDFVYGMWLILQHKKPDDFILATNESHSVREFVEEVGKVLGINIIWKGKGLKEKGIDKKTGKIIIEIDEKYFRPAEVDILQGDYSKAKKELGWKPTTKFKELVKLMAEADLEKECHKESEVHKVKSL